MKVRYLIIALLAGATSLPAQTIIPLDYRQYMERVVKGNLELSAERLNVPAAQAELSAAKVFSDPTLSLSYSNNQDKTVQMGQGYAVELGKTISFGKRSANIGLARSQSELAQLELEGFFRTLRAEATIAFLEARQQYELYKVKEESYESMRQLAESDSLRCAAGEIGEIDAMQTKVEAGILLNELAQAQTDLHNAFLGLANRFGIFSADTLFYPEVELELPIRYFSLDTLMGTAMRERPELLAAQKGNEVAAAMTKVVRRDRRLDFDLSLGIERAFRARNEEAPSPPYTGVTVGVGIPLKFSNANKGLVRAARYRERQVNLQYEQAVIRIRTEVMQAYKSYQTLTTQVRHFEDGYLGQAREVMEGKIYSYNKGEVSLLEVLDARRTYAEVRARYIETLFSYSSALVELERVAGIWDVEM